MGWCLDLELVSVSLFTVLGYGIIKYVLSRDLLHSSISATIAMKHGVAREKGKGYQRLGYPDELAYFERPEVLGLSIVLLDGHFVPLFFFFSSVRRAGLDSLLCTYTTHCIISYRPVIHRSSCHFPSLHLIHCPIRYSTIDRRLDRLILATHTADFLRAKLAHRFSFCSLVYR